MNKGQRPQQIERQVVERLHHHKVKETIAEDRRINDKQRTTHRRVRNAQQQEDNGQFAHCDMGKQAFAAGRKMATHATEDPQTDGR
jgi:hypothetical protein